MRNLPFFLVAPIAVVSYAVIPSVYAEDFLTVQQTQQVLFPTAKTFVDASITLSNEHMEAIKKLAGSRQRQNTQKIWRAETDGQLQGWLLIDDVIGKHDFITYGTAISPQGDVIGIEILSYRENHGGQVRDAQWRRNFVGKHLQDSFKLGDDIPNISGATLSCRNVTEGVKRLLAIHHILLSQAPRS